MASAINMYNIKGSQVVLIGFSGGGALAILMASKIKKLEKIVTVNANLDTSAWTDYHAYTRLSGSLNPINYLESNKGIKQLHLLGERDKNVPHKLWRDKLEAANSTIISHPNFTHHCCWSSIWPQVLTSIADL
jgi:predicted esterase